MRRVAAPARAGSAAARALDAATREDRREREPQPPARLLLRRPRGQLHARRRPAVRHPAGRQPDHQVDGVVLRRRPVQEERPQHGADHGRATLLFGYAEQIFTTAEQADSAMRRTVDDAPGRAARRHHQDLRPLPHAVPHRRVPRALPRGDGRARRGQLGPDDRERRAPGEPPGRRGTGRALLAAPAHPALPARRADHGRRPRSPLRRQGRRAVVRAGRPTPDRARARLEHASDRHAEPRAQRRHPQDRHGIEFGGLHHGVRGRGSGTRLPLRARHPGGARGRQAGQGAARRRQHRPRDRHHHAGRSLQVARRPRLPRRARGVGHRGLERLPRRRRRRSPRRPPPEAQLRIRVPSPGADPRPRLVPSPSHCVTLESGRGASSDSIGGTS